MSKLVGSEPSPDAAHAGGVLELLAGGRRFPLPSARWPVDHTQQRSDREVRSELEPRVELVPRPAVDPNLAMLAALAAANENGAS
jgi:hypothetical protein